METRMSPHIWTISNSSWYGALWGALLFGLVALGGLYFVVRALLDGETIAAWARGQGGGMRVTRADNPIFFWFTFLIYLFATMFGSTIAWLFLLHALKLRA
jgi:hypothetical protein